MALEDERGSEIMANPDGALFIERLGTGRERQDAGLPACDVERIIRLIASHIGAPCDRDHPIVSAELPGTGERFEGVLPPVSLAPAFSIRKPARRAMSIADWVASGAMTRGHALILQSALARRENILISGGTSTGKTTLEIVRTFGAPVRIDRVVLRGGREHAVDAPLVEGATLRL